MQFPRPLRSLAIYTHSFQSEEYTMKLEQKNIVITGGTSGIGYEIVKNLHSGNRLMVIARDSKKLTRLARKFDGIITCCADLSQISEVENAASQARQHLDSVDLLINNAAIQQFPTFLDDDFSYASIQQEITVNLTALCSLTALLLPAMLRQDEAAIVNVNSGLALVPKTNSAIYCATKAAVNVFSQSLRYQLEGTNVKVLQAFMPLVATGMTEGRGTGKMTATDAAASMIRGIENDIEEHYIGRIKILRLLNHLAPTIAHRMMKAS
jgi:uncharacterized oxidoreductase